MPKTHQKLPVHTAVFAAFYLFTLKRSKTLISFEERPQPSFDVTPLFSKANVFAGQRFQMYAFTMKMMSVLCRIIVDGRQKHIKEYAFPENALVCTRPELFNMSLWKMGDSELSKSHFLYNFSSMLVNDPLTL